MVFYGYCTKCDRDVFIRGAPCTWCHDTMYIVEPDRHLQCIICQRTWNSHGSPTSASMCKGGFNGHFTPLPCLPSTISAIVAPTIISPSATIGSAQILARKGPSGMRPSLGMSCAKCNDFNEYAQVNAPDGKFICYTCRH